MDLNLAFLHLVSDIKQMQHHAENLLYSCRIHPTLPRSVLAPVNYLAQSKIAVSCLYGPILTLGIAYNDYIQCSTTCDRF